MISLICWNFFIILKVKIVIKWIFLIKLVVWFFVLVFVLVLGREGILEKDLKFEIVIMVCFGKF